MNNILLPLDLEAEKSWKPLIPLAVGFAKNEGAKLHLLTVAPRISAIPGLPSGADFGEPDIPSPEEYNKRMLAIVEKSLEDFAKAEFPAELNVDRIVASGNVYRTILETAKKVNADLIIMSAYRPSMKSFLVGANAERVARHANCSVFLVRP